jgi:hypothetical protein
MAHTLPAPPHHGVLSVTQCPPSHAIQCPVSYSALPPTTCSAQCPLTAWHVVTLCTAGKNAARNRDLVSQRHLWSALKDRHECYPFQAEDPRFMNERLNTEEVEGEKVEHRFIETFDRDGKRAIEVHETRTKQDGTQATSTLRGARASRIVSKHGPHSAHALSTASTALLSLAGGARTMYVCGLLHCSHWLAALHCIHCILLTDGACATHICVRVVQVRKELGGMGFEDMLDEGEDAILDLVVEVEQSGERALGAVVAGAVALEQQAEGAVAELRRPSMSNMAAGAGGGGSSRGVVAEPPEARRKSFLARQSMSEQERMDLLRKEALERNVK